MPFRRLSAEMKVKRSGFAAESVDVGADAARRLSKISINSNWSAVRIYEPDRSCKKKFEILELASTGREVRIAMSPVRHMDHLSAMGVLLVFGQESSGPPLKIFLQIE